MRGGENWDGKIVYRSMIKSRGCMGYGYRGGGLKGQMVDGKASALCNTSFLGFYLI